MRAADLGCGQAVRVDGEWRIIQTIIRTGSTVAVITIDGTEHQWDDDDEVIVP